MPINKLMQLLNKAPIHFFILLAFTFIFEESDLVKIVHNYFLPQDTAIGVLKISMKEEHISSNNTLAGNALPPITNTLLLFKHSSDSKKDITLLQSPSSDGADSQYFLGSRGLAHPSLTSPPNNIGEGDAKAIFGVNMPSNTVLAIMAGRAGNNSHQFMEKDGDYKIEVDNTPIDITRNENLFIMTKNEIERDIWTQRIVLIIVGFFAVFIAWTIRPYTVLGFPE